MGNAEDFHYMHSTGAWQAKAEWIEGLRALAGRRRRVVSKGIADLHGDVAVVTADLDVVWNDGRIALDRYVRVYRRQESGWQAVFQRTFIAPDRASHAEASEPGAGSVH
jgi:hypothetical protein